MNLKRLLNKLNKAEAEFLLRAMREHSNAYYEYKDGKEYEETDSRFDYGLKMHDFTLLLADKIGLKEED